MLVGAAMTSCSGDFLNAENKSSGGQTDEDYFSTNSSSLLYTAYNSLKDIAGTVNIYVEGTDLYVANRNDAPNLMKYAFTTDDDDCTNLYENCYTTILYANGAVKYAKQQNGDNSATEQEARFIRDYCYYVLTQQFGAVPYIDSYVQDATRSYPRVELATIYDNLINDLTSIYDNCKLEDYMNKPNGNSTKEVGHVSKQAVAALLAKIELAAGWDTQTSVTNVEKGTYEVTGTSHFEAAEKWAGIAINLSPSSLGSMDFASVWNQDNEDLNTQTIFSVQYDRDNYPGTSSEGGHSLQNNFGGYYGSTAASSMKNPGSLNSQSVKSMYLWEDGDQRFDVTYMTTVYNATVDGSETVWGTEGWYGYYNSANPDKLNIFIKYYPWYTDSASIKSYLSANADRFQQGSCKNANPRAYKLTSPNVVIYTVNAAGTVDSTTQTVSAFDKRADGGCISVKKFDDKNSEKLDKNNDYRDIVLIHLSDMYLARAEARLMQNNKSGFFEDINAVRSRAGLTENLNSISDYSAPYENVSSTYSKEDGSATSSSAVTELDLLLDEYAREFYAENRRWMDLRRTKQLVKYNVLFNKYISDASAMKPSGDYKLYRPIPQAAIEKNDGLSSADQNPGY